MDDQQRENGTLSPAATAIQQEEAYARRVGRARKAGRGFIRILCAALIAASVAVLLYFPALGLAGEGRDLFLDGAQFQADDSLAITRDVLLHSDEFDRAAITAAGVDLGEGHVVPLLESADAVVREVMDGELSPLELLQGAILIQRLLPDCEKLSITEATLGLFDALGIKDDYADCQNTYTRYHRIAAGALIGYEALLGLLALCALASILLSLFGRSRVFDWLLLIGEVLLLGLFWGAGYLSASLGVLPSGLTLSPLLLPGASILLLIGVLLLKRVFLGKAKRA